jgi:hypothetical protein
MVICAAAMKAHADDPNAAIIRVDRSALAAIATGLALLAADLAAAARLSHLGRLLSFRVRSRFVFSSARRGHWSLSFT